MNVFYYWDTYQTNTNCIKNSTLPNSLINIPCDKICIKGNYLDYNDNTCKECPENTYSLGGAFRVGGRLNQWTESDLNKFGNTCSYIKNGKLLYDCPNFSPVNETFSLSAGEITGSYENSFFFYELTYRVRLKKPGKVCYSFYILLCNKLFVLIYLNNRSHLNIGKILCQILPSMEYLNSL